MEDDNRPSAVADMGAYRRDFNEASRKAYERASIVVAPDQLVAYRYMARTAWERLRQEGRSNGLTWFDPELRVVPAVNHRYAPHRTFQLTTVAIGVVHEAYVDADGKNRERVIPGRAQVSIQLPNENGRFPALWVSDFNTAAGPTETDPHYCERVDWNSPLRLKGDRK